MITHSIRGRIQLWHTTLLALIVGGLLVAFYYHQKQILTQDLDRELSSKSVKLLPHYFPVPGMGLPARIGEPGPGDDRPDRMDAPERMRPPPPRRGPGRLRPDRASENLAKAKDELIQQGSYFIAWNVDGKELGRTINAPAERTRPETPSNGGDRQFSRTKDNNREYIHISPKGNVVLIGRPLNSLRAKLHTLTYQLAAIWLTVVAVGFGVGWWLITRSLRPIRSISDSARHIANGNLSQRIDSKETESELGQLTEVLNQTFSKLEHAFDQQVRFTADASHELRTPVAVILAKCQFALMRDRDPEKYKEALSTCEASAQHIRRLVESLLELARIDSGEFQIIRTDSDLGRIAKDGAHLLHMLAEAKQVDIQVNCPDTPCFLDPDRIHQVVINLLSNAVKYTQEGGRIAISTRTEADECILAIADNGQGIAAEDLPHLFDRFYRADKGRSNERQSTGLGLAITKAIVEAHGGRIEVTARIGQGSTFSVRLPRKPGSAAGSKHGD